MMNLRTKFYYGLWYVFYTIISPYRYATVVNGFCYLLQSSLIPAGMFGECFPSIIGQRKNETGVDKDMGLYDRLTSGHGIDYENQYTTTQQKVITFTPLASSILSIIGSVAICYIILSDHQQKLGKVKQRIILCMSILDIICSFWFGLWGLPIPEGTPGVYGAHGSRQTCSAQGFFIQWQISVPMYNAALSVYYYLVVVKQKKDDEIAKHYEPWMHFLCNIYPFLTGIASFFIDGGLYNFDSIGCWIAPYPRGCKHNDDLTCIRGNHAYIFQWLFAGIEEASAALIIVYCMWYVYNEVGQAVSVMRRYSFKKGSISDSQTLAEKSRNTLYQALSYVAVVVATRFWSFVVVMIDEFGGANPFWVVVLQQFWFPLQGFWNAIIYIQPYYKNVRLQNPDAPWYWIIKEAIQHAPTEDDVRRGLYDNSYSINSNQKFSKSSSHKKSAKSSGSKTSSHSINSDIRSRQLTTTTVDCSSLSSRMFYTTKCYRSREFTIDNATKSRRSGEFISRDFDSRDFDSRDFDSRDNLRKSDCFKHIDPVEPPSIPEVPDSNVVLKDPIGIQEKEPTFAIEDTDEENQAALTDTTMKGTMGEWERNRDNCKSKATMCFVPLKPVSNDPKDTPIQEKQPKCTMGATGKDEGTTVELPDTSIEGTVGGWNCTPQATTYLVPLQPIDVEPDPLATMSIGSESSHDQTHSTFSEETGDLDDENYGEIVFSSLEETMESSVEKSDDANGEVIAWIDQLVARLDRCVDGLTDKTLQESEPTCPGKTTDQKSDYDEDDNETIMA